MKTAYNNKIEATGINRCGFFAKAGCPCASFASFPTRSARGERGAER